MIRKDFLPISFQTSQTPFRPRFASAHTRAIITIILLAGGAVVDVVSILISLLIFFFPDLAPVGDEMTEPSVVIVALLQLGLAIVQIIFYIGTIVLFLMWLYRSYENLPSFGVRQSTLKYSSGWAVGSFFIPFVSLVIPYRAMKELWNKSVPNSGDLFSSLSPPWFFPLWWFAWLVSNFLGQAELRLSWQEKLSPETSALLGVSASAFSLMAAVLAIMVVREIDRQQTASAMLIANELMTPGPPPPPVLTP